MKYYAVHHHYYFIELIMIGIHVQKEYTIIQTLPPKIDIMNCSHVIIDAMYDIIYKNFLLYRA